jgi:hypothetical protein
VAGAIHVLTNSRRWRDAVQQPLEELEAGLQFNRTLAHIRTPDGTWRPLRFSHVARLEIVSAHAEHPWLLRVAHADGVLDLTPDRAAPLAGPLLARLNHRGGTPQQITEATRRITEAGDADRYIRTSATLRRERRRKNAIFWNDDVGVLGLTPTELLALEIAMNEDAERQAMQGELEALAAAWRDAEEIAAIADRLFED